MHMATLVVTVLVCSLLAAPLGAEAQPAAKVYRIGVLETTSPATAATVHDAFRQGLRELGYVEGQNLVLEYRWAGGKAERFPRLAAELVALKVDVIVARGTPASLAAKTATPTIPVVMAAAGNPVGTGLVHSLARPGANVTGLSGVSEDLAGKRIELVKDVVPQVSRIGFLWNPGNPSNRLVFEETRVAARRFGLTVESLAVRKSEDLEPVFEAARRARVQAIVMSVDATIQHQAPRITALAIQNRLPAMYGSREFVEAGGLMSYAVHFPDLYRRAATYVDRILRGAKPAELPVEQPTKFEFVINLRTARALGLTIPPSLLARVDHTIE
jgi:putative ABC transport system substrate-binding protein